MHIFHRMADVLSANLNELVDRCEDPERALRQAIREMEHAVQATLDSAVKAVANEKLLAKELAAQTRQAEVCQQRARDAVADKNDDLARVCLSQRLQHEKLSAALTDEHRSAAEASGKLRRLLSGMRAKLAEAKRRQATLSARLRAAEARKRTPLTPPVGAASPGFGRFDRLAERVQLAEAEADAYDELSGVKEDADCLDDESLTVEQELASLKESLGA